MAGSEDTMLGDGGVFGMLGLMVSTCNGGGNAGISVSSVLEGNAAGCSGGASSVISLDGFFVTGAGAGLLNMLAQLRVPSGFRLGLVGSVAGGALASEA